MAHSEIVQLILTKSSIGSGTETDPCRELVEYFERDGTLLFRVDAWKESQADPKLKVRSEDFSAN